MKKTITGLSVIMIAAAGTAFAGTATQIPLAGTSIGTQSFRPSNSVQLFVASAAGTSLVVGGYSVSSFHSSGNREFASNNGESKIYWRDTPTTGHIAVGDVGVDTSTNPPTYTPTYTSGWNSL